MARQIKARAIDRCGDLLREIEPAGGERTGRERPEVNARKRCL
jgi:hypothetical protein